MIEYPLYEEAGWASLWVGTFTNWDDLDNYITPIYDDDGDIIARGFMRDFELGDWDEDFREAEVRPAPDTNIRRLLHGCSDDTALIPQFEAMLGAELPNPVNTVILLYEYAYRGPIKNARSEFGELRFAGIGRHSMKGLLNPDYSPRDLPG